MRGKKGTAPAAAGAVPAVLAGEILELRESVSAHEACIRRDTADLNRKIRELGRYWTQRRIAGLVGVTESRINQIITKVRTMDEAGEEELVAALIYDNQNDRKGVCPQCQRAYVLVGPQRTTVRKHSLKGPGWVVCDGSGATVVPGEGVEA